MILPDEIALRRPCGAGRRWKLVTYVRGTRQGWTIGDAGPVAGRSRSRLVAMRTTSEGGGHRPRPCVTGKAGLIRPPLPWSLPRREPPPGLLQREPRRRPWLLPQPPLPLRRLPSSFMRCSSRRSCAFLPGLALLGLLRALALGDAGLVEETQHAIGRLRARRRANA